jgi:hypothetical protein
MQLQSYYSVPSHLSLPIYYRIWQFPASTGLLLVGLPPTSRYPGERLTVGSTVLAPVVPLLPCIAGESKVWGSLLVHPLVRDPSYIAQGQASKS